MPTSAVTTSVIGTWGFIDDVGSKGEREDEDIGFDIVGDERGG